MHPPDASVAVVRRIKQEVDRLTLKQVKALADSVYIAMTHEQLHEYDRRRSRITTFIETLNLLERAQLHD